MTEKSDWLAGLRKGDPVVVCSYFPKTKRVKRIARFTKRYIVTEDDRQFRRRDGHSPGESWPGHWIEEPTIAEARKAKAGKAGR